MKKIIINSRFLTQETTGVQRFAIELSKRLKKTELDIEFVSPHNIIDYKLANELNVNQIGVLTVSYTHLTLPTTSRV